MITTESRIDKKHFEQTISTSIWEIDLSPIKFKLVKEEGWTEEVANLIETAYKGYLHLCKEYPEVNFVPTKAMDEMWHKHILDTRKYMKDCEKAFGYYLHHFPYFGLRSEEDKALMERSFERTVSAFKEHLNLDLHGIHSLAAQLLGEKAKNAMVCSSNNCSGGSCGNNSIAEAMVCSSNNCSGGSCGNNRLNS